MSTVTDPIADFLARVRNGTRAQKSEVLVPYSKIKAELARILKDEGYISDYSVDTSAAHPRIKFVGNLDPRMRSTRVDRVIGNVTFILQDATELGPALRVPSDPI